MRGLQSAIDDAGIFYTAMVPSAHVPNLMAIVESLRPYWYTAVFFAAASLPFSATKSIFMFPTKQWLPRAALLSASLFFTVAHLATARCLSNILGLNIVTLSPLECPWGDFWKHDKP